MLQIFTMFNKIKIIICVTSLISGLTSCNPDPKPEQKSAPITKTVIKEQGIKLEAGALSSNLDPVCGMSISESMEDTASFNGKLFGFCSSGCKVDFLKEPGNYVK